VNDDLSSLLKAPILGSIRQMGGSNKNNKLLIYQDTPSPAAEDFRMLHSKIQLMCTKQPKTILITSPNAGDGRSMLVANLGVVAAQFGYRTIVVDADGVIPDSRQ
jgi:Mrp family chromosome partitioning ATPase